MLNLVAELPEDLLDVGTQKLEWKGWLLPVYNFNQCLGRKGDKVRLQQILLDGEPALEVVSVESRELEDPICGLGDSIRELIDNYSTGHDIKVCTLVGLLHCIANEIFIDNDAYDLVDPDYMDPDEYDAL